MSTDLSDLCIFFPALLGQRPNADKVLKVTEVTGLTLLHLLLTDCMFCVVCVSSHVLCSAGGSLASSVPNCQRELEHVHIHKTKLTEVEKDLVFCFRIH